MTAQPKPTAADVLTEHAPARRGAVECRCGWFGSSRLAWGRDHAVHQADVLAAAGLLATAEHDAQVRRDACEILQRLRGGDIEQEYIDHVIGNP